ncbi:TraR/DksA C4-type zinc finger protein [Streptomyces sp. NPDC006617]|uniref:TraR/DksA family transcriptional regulator n=1 Tax=Streptomyces sp. NPDC006617 TaxID=3155354 RepID=UPI0033BA7308
MGDDRPDDAVSPAEAEDLRRRLGEQAVELRRQTAGAEARKAQLWADCLLDAADAGSATEALTRHVSETERALTLLARVEEALDRFEDGGYGHCVQCGEAIDGERLRAFPHVERCLRCESRGAARSG